MPVNSITYQPATAQLLAAYRPIILKVAATATGGDPVPPYVVCDIYIDDVFYTSIFRTTTDTSGIWVFDIADALRKYLAPDIAQVDNNNILQSSHSSAKVLCKFRASDLDADNFTVEEGTKPIQATRTTDAVSGTGLSSNSFFVVNAALQHEDNQNLETHLDAFKTGEWSDDAYPLSHRNKYFFCPGDSDHFPVIFKGDCLQTDLVLNYRLRGSNEFLQATAVDVNTCDPLPYSLEVDGNGVTVTMDDPIPSGHSVLVQYKKQADATWIDAGNFTTQEINFYVNGDEIAGDYDIRVIHFCSACLSADPELGEFTLDGSESNLAWRGIHPFCVQTDLGATVYTTLDLRNETTDVVWIPDNITPSQKWTETKRDLYVKFFSDAAHLTPLNVSETNLKIYVKRRIEQEISTGSIENTIQESIDEYTISPAGVNEFLLASAIRINYLQETFSTYPTVTAYNDSAYSYTPYPTHELIQGNTGDKGFADLQEYNTDTLIPTGTEKENVDSDPDYIAPAEDETSCPEGPPSTVLNYGVLLEVSKLEFIYNSASDYAETVAAVGAYYYSFRHHLPTFTDITINVKAKTLDGSNVSGLMKVSVAYVNSSGAAVTADFNVPNNVETTLPQTFQNIISVGVSNY